MYDPYMILALVHSKSNARPMASRIRGSLKASRRVLKYQPWIGAGASSAMVSFLTRPSRNAGKIIARRPEPRGELFLKIRRAVLEGLERHDPVAEILVADAIEVVLSDIHRKIIGPIIRHAIQLDETARLETPDLVRSGGERRFERCRFEIAALPVSLREDRYSGHHQMKIAAAIGRKSDDQQILGLRLRRRHLRQDRAINRMALFFQDMQRECRRLSRLDATHRESALPGEGESDR